MLRQRPKKAAVQLAHDLRDRVILKSDSMFLKLAAIMKELADKNIRDAVFVIIDATPKLLGSMIA